MRSMRFGIILLLLIAAVSVVGSLIPQGNEPAYYAKIYGNGHPWILLLGLDNIFKGWVFIALTVLLSLNLTLCSVVRIRTFLKMFHACPMQVPRHLKRSGE